MYMTIFVQHDFLKNSCQNLRFDLLIKEEKYSQLLC